MMSNFNAWWETMSNFHAWWETASMPDSRMALAEAAWMESAEIHTRIERERLLPVLKLAREWLDDVCNKDTELATEEGMQVAEKIDAAIKETPAE